MSFTVRVIFWGLMGFVPNQEGQQGLTALLVKPETSVQQCPVDEHVPAVYLVDGECEGEKCMKTEDHDDDVANKLGTITPKLRWYLNGEDLEIFGEEKKLELLEKKRKKWFGLFGELLQAPRSLRQAADISWVPSLDLFTGGYGKVREECLVAENKCHLLARFTVRGGKASACHLFHEPEQNPRDDKRTIPIFDFKAPGADSVPFAHQAIADAVQVQFEVEGDHMELRSWGFASSAEQQQDTSHHDANDAPPPGQQQLKASVILRPAVNSRTVTLLVVNGPRSPAHNASDGVPCAHSQPHSTALFQLLARQPAVVPERSKCRTERGNPGSCEREITALEKASFPPGLSPHSTSLCDGAAYH